MEIRARENEQSAQEIDMLSRRGTAIASSILLDVAVLGGLM